MKSVTIAMTLVAIVMKLAISNYSAFLKSSTTIS